MDDDSWIGTRDHAADLADLLEGREEVTLSTSDIELCVKALRDRVALIDANLA